MNKATKGMLCVPRLVANTADMPREQWLALRKEGLGGSDAAAVAGVSKYSSPYTAFWDKVESVTQDKPEHVLEAAYWGNVHESTIRKEFAERVNRERKEQGLPPLRVIHRQAIFANDEYDFIRTNLDGWITGHEKGRGIFEAKTAHYMLRGDWEGNDVPNAYLLQCQHNMLVMDASFAYLAVLIGGNTFKYYYIERDEELIQYLITIESAFWNNHVLTRIPPEMTGLEAEKDMLRELFPMSMDDNESFINLPDYTIEILEKIDVLKQLEGELKVERTKHENELKAVLGDTEWAYSGLHKVTWKTSKNGTRPFKYKLFDTAGRDKLYKKRSLVLKKERGDIEKLVKSKGDTA